MILKPCVTCWWWNDRDCEVHEKTLKALRRSDIKLTCASFQCHRRLLDHGPGRRVAIVFDWETYYTRPAEKHLATVMHHEHGGGTCARIVVCFDNPAKIDDAHTRRFGGPYIKNKSGIMRIRPNCCEPLSQTIKICKTCGWPKRIKRRAGWFCPECAPEE